MKNIIIHQNHMNKLEFLELLFFRSVRIPAKNFCGKTKLKGSTVLLLRP